MINRRPDLCVNCFDWEQFEQTVTAWGFTEQDYSVEHEWDELTLMPWAFIQFKNERLKLLWRLKNV